MSSTTNQDGRGDPTSPPVNTPGNGGEERVVIMRLCSCTTGMSYGSELVPFPASYEDAMLDAITVFFDSLPPNTTPSEIEIKYAYKCADGSGGWAGLSSAKGSPEKWRQALKASYPGACELGVFHIPSIPAENIRRVFPYSSQATQDASGAGINRTRVSVKFNAEQIVFDAPPTLADCIPPVKAAISEAMREGAYRYWSQGAGKGNFGRITPCQVKLYAHSIHGRSPKELDEEDYSKMRMENLGVIYLEAKYTF